MVTLSRLDISRCYKFVASEEENNKWQGIQLLESTGKYKDIIYKYGNVGFGKEENPDGTLPMIFDYDIIKNPNNIDLGDEKKFVDHIGDILLELMEKQIKDGTAIIKW